MPGKPEAISSVYRPSIWELICVLTQKRAREREREMEGVFS